MSLFDRLSTNVRRRGDSRSLRSAAEVDGTSGQAAADDSGAEEDIRQAFLSPVGIEPAVLGRRSVPTAGASREPEMDERTKDATANRAVVVGEAAGEPAPPAPSPTPGPIADAPWAGVPTSRSGRRAATVRTPVAPAPPESPSQPASRPAPDSTAALIEASPAREPGVAAAEPSIVARRSRVPLMAGLLFGGIVVISGTLLVGSLVATRAPGEPSSSPTAVPSGTAAPAATLPAGVTAGFLEMAAVNDRLASAAEELDAAVQARRPSASVIGPLLRAIAAAVRSGQAAAQRVTAGPGVQLFADDAMTFYRALAVVAADGLAAPLRDNDAYARSGRQMQELLASLPEIAAATRAAAARAGVTLPPPSASPAPLPSPAAGG